MELKANIYRLFIISKCVTKRKLIFLKIVLNLHPGVFEIENEYRSIPIFSSIEIEYCKLRVANGKSLYFRLHLSYTDPKLLLSHSNEMTTQQYSIIFVQRKTLNGTNQYYQRYLPVKALNLRVGSVVVSDLRSKTDSTPSIGYVQR